MGFKKGEIVLSLMVEGTMERRGKHISKYRITGYNENTNLNRHRALSACLYLPLSTLHSLTALHLERVPAGHGVEHILLQPDAELWQGPNFFAFSKCWVGGWVHFHNNNDMK